MNEHKPQLTQSHETFKTEQTAQVHKLHHALLSILSN